MEKARGFQFEDYYLQTSFPQYEVQEFEGTVYTFLRPAELYASAWPWIELRFREFGGKYSQHFGSTFEVPMGRISVDSKNPSYTMGANTCFAGATFDKQGGIYIFHSLGLKLPDCLQDLIDEEKVQGGIVGGWAESIGYERNMEYFERACISVIEPNTDINSWFNVAALPKYKAVVYQYETMSKPRR